MVRFNDSMKATSKNLKLCFTQPSQNTHLPHVNSAFGAVASLDFGVFRGCLNAATRQPPEVHSPDVAVTDSQIALNYLKAGNYRFVHDTTMPRNTNKIDRDLTKDSQKPFAAILTCADSRLAPEIFFDQKIGDIFVLRNAGNVADFSVIGSLEFAAGALGVPLVVVVGHTRCLAVYSACSGRKDFFPGLQALLDGISENLGNMADEEQAAIDNTHGQVEKIKANAVIRESGAVVVGASYDIATGKVTFFD